MALPPPEKDVNRKLKPHKKSRGGCGNCKLRAVKCDESKPRCKRCSAYGVTCNYDCKSPDLQLLVDGAFSVEVLQRFSCSLIQAIPSMNFPQLRQLSAASDESNDFYPLRNLDLKLLRKFQSRTVLTMSTDKSLPIYRNETIKIAFIHPFLMHAVLLLTLLHDRHLSAKENTRLSPTEAFHWYRSTALFNSKLSGPIRDSERDALWIAAALLGTATFYYIEASTPEEAWPLKPPSSLDLNWLRMSAGKEEIWRITQPMRPDSAFRALVTEAGNFLPIPTAVSRLEALPSEFLKLFDLDATSNTKDNPYRAPVSTLAGIMNSDCSLSIILSFLYFINHMRPEFKRLLERKDPRALLLLAYWFAKVFQSQHCWVWRRAALECQAICIYLERYHTNESCIQELLQFPKLVCAIDGYDGRNRRNG